MTTGTSSSLDTNKPLGLCCGKTWTPMTARLEASGPHWKASCGGCGKYFCFLPQRARVHTFYFGKYKDRLVTDIWKEDPDYCAWLLDQSWVKPRLRQVLEESAPHACTPR